MGLLDDIGAALDRPWSAVGATPEQISTNPWGNRGMVLSALGQSFRDQGAVPFYQGLQGYADQADQRRQDALKRQMLEQQMEQQRQLGALFAGGEQPAAPQGPQQVLADPALGRPGPTPMRAQAMQQQAAAAPVNPNKAKADVYRRAASIVAATSPETAQKYIELADKLDPREEFLAPVETADGFVQPSKTGGYRRLEGVAPKPERPPSDQQLYEYAKQQGYPGTLEQWLLSQRAAGATRVSQTVAGKAEETFAETLAKQRAEQMPKAYADAQNAAGVIDGMNTVIAQSQKGTFSGPLAPGAIGAASFLSSIGVDVAPDLLVSSRMTEAVINDLILKVTAAAGGARGFTVQEMPIIYNSLPKLADDPRARIAIAQLLQRRAKKTIDEYNALRKSSEGLPMFDRFGTPAIEPPAATPGQRKSLDEIFK